MGGVEGKGVNSGECSSVDNSTFKKSLILWRISFNRACANYDKSQHHPSIERSGGGWD